MTSHFDPHTAPIADVLDMAPPWTDDLVSELAILCRSHASVRSAIMFAGELAQQKMQALRTADSWENTCRAQGAIDALTAYIGILTHQMSALDLQPTAQSEDYDNAQVN